MRSHLYKEFIYPRLHRVPLNILPYCPLAIPLIMATYSDSYSLPRQTIRSSLISIVDILFPGLTNISAAIQQLHVGHTNHYAQMICISGIILLLGKYAYKYLKAFVETYFSPWLPQSLGTVSDHQQHTPSTSQTPVRRTTCW